MFSFKSNAQDETKRFIIQSQDASICNGGKLNLSVDVSWEMNNLTDVIHKIDDKYLDQIHHTVNWYVGENDITPIGKGSSFNTPEISSSKNYYASVNYSGGLSVITEDFKKVGGEGLIFDLFTPAVINSVDVYSNMPGKISVVIKKTDGTQIINKSFPVTNGLNKLPLNCSLPSGWGFIIEAFGLSPDIKLTTIKHDKWPISLGTFGEIVEGTENKKKYNYFFNWDVSTARVPVNATIVKSTQNVTTKTECDKYFWTETSETYDKSGTYSKVIGCHTEKLYLTITPSSKKKEEITACESYVWSADGKKYETSGTYTTTSNCLTQELNLTIEQRKTNVTTQTSTDSFTWGVNNKKYEISGTYTEIKGCLTEKLVLKVSYTDGVIPQSVLSNRNPDKRKDFVNVHFDPRYTLFDLWSDEPILPDENGIYHIWLADNETKKPIQFDGSAEKLSKYPTYKFKNLDNCKNWCGNIPFSNTTNSITNSTDANSSSKTTTFKEVKIGNQIWMKENLNVDHFRNGDRIPEVKSWVEKGAYHYHRGYDAHGRPYCMNYEFKPANGEKYGKLYCGFAVSDPRGLAPAGWHIPTEDEWRELEKFLGENDEGKKLRSTSGWESYTTGGTKTCTHCKDWNTEYRSKKECDVCRDRRYVPAPTYTHSGNGSNASSFSALPGGEYDWQGFNNVGSSISFWSSSIDKEDYYEDEWWCKTAVLSNRYFVASMNEKLENHACYVRCIKD